MLEFIKSQDTKTINEKLFNIDLITTDPDIQKEYGINENMMTMLIKVSGDLHSYLTSLEPNEVIQNNQPINNNYENPANPQLGIAQKRDHNGDIICHFNPENITQATNINKNKFNIPSNWMPWEDEPREYKIKITGEIELRKAEIINDSLLEMNIKSGDIIKDCQRKNHHHNCFK